MPRRVAMLLALLVLAPLLAGPTRLGAQAAETDPGALVREAWTAVDTAYYDSDFHGVDWAAVGDTFRARGYRSTEEAYDAVRRMLARLGNPATRFLTPEQAAALVAEFTGRPHAGPGLLEILSMDTNEETGEITIVTPVPRGPAARSGLRPGDVVVSVDGAPAGELGLAETASRLRGPPGTQVEILLRRDGETRRVRLVREEIPAVDPVEGFVREEDGRVVGYLGLRQFTPDAPEQLVALVEELEVRGAGAWVLDLRNNPGGMIDALLEVAGMFLGDAPVARLRGRSPEPTTLAAEGARQVAGPVVVLVNEGSASASEALASALQHHGRATVVGDRTFGKGLAHGLAPLADGSAVVVTVGRLETLAGRDVLTEGVEPDVLVRSPAFPVLDGERSVADEEDAEYRRAVEILTRRGASGPR